MELGELVVVNGQEEIAQCVKMCLVRTKPNGF